MKTKLIFSPVVARKLLKLGNVIVDIKPNKHNVSMSVFIFEDNKKFRDDLNQIKE